MSLVNDDSGTLLVASLIGTTAITYVGRVIQNKEITIKPLIGMFVLGVGLFGIGLASVETANGFAILMFVSALLINGTSVFGAITKVVS